MKTFARFICLLLVGSALAVPVPIVAAPKKPAKTTKKAPVLHWPRISRKNQGDYYFEIIHVQRLLNLHGAKLKEDSNFGAQTEAAVKDFQRKHRLVVDGVVGPQTWPKLVPRLRRGTKGQAVKVLQGAMIGHNGEWIEEFKKEPGVFGFETERAVRSYQKAGSITVDGIAGLQTWCILMGGTVKS